MPLCPVQDLLAPSPARCRSTYLFIFKLYYTSIITNYLHILCARPKQFQLLSGCPAQDSLTQGPVCCRSTCLFTYIYLHVVYMYLHVLCAQRPHELQLRASAPVAAMEAPRGNTKPCASLSLCVALCSLTGLVPEGGWCTTVKRPCHRRDLTAGYNNTNERRRERERARE